MSRETEDAVYIGGFCIFGFLLVVLAILKLTVVAYWSWWRVALPLLAFLKLQRAVYSHCLYLLPLAQG